LQHGTSIFDFYNNIWLIIAMSAVSSGFDPFDSEETLQLRYDAVEAFLASSVGEVHPHLIRPNRRYSAAGNKAAQLAYGAIVRRVADERSPDLPAGAIRNVDPLANLTLMERHLADINAYLLHDCCRAKDLGSTGLPFEELPELHPMIEGYSWYRGYQVYTGGSSSVIVLTPWMQPWIEGGSPVPILYTLGDPSAAQVREVAFAYAAETTFV